MRFFAHDGKTTHGPAGIDDILKLPGFDGDTLICPVGSNDTADWKPAMAYPPFKKALLESVAVTPPAPAPSLAASPLFTPIDSPESMLAPTSSTPILPLPMIQPMQPMPPPPAPVEPPSAMPSPLDLPQASVNPFDRLAAPAPVTDPFARLDPMLNFPPEPAPATSFDAPKLPLQPGKMGQLAAFDEPMPAASAPALAPEPDPEPAAVPVWKRPLVLAAFAGAAVLSAAGTYMMLGKPAPVETVAELSPSAPSPVPEDSPAPAVYTPPPVTASPLMPAPRSTQAKTPPTAKPKRARKPRPAQAPMPFVLEEPGGGDILIESRAPEEAPKAPAAVKKPAPKIDQRPAAKPKRVRKPRPARAPKPVVLEDPGAGDILIESRAPKEAPKTKAAAKKGAKAAELDPLLEALLSDAMLGGAGAAKPSEFSLPGLSRPVSASDRAITLAPIASDPALNAALTGPGKPAPRPGIGDEPAKSAEGDQLALMQVHEQFDFCSQLLTQGAFGDYYDTCLCKEAREASPYRGRRGSYVTTKKKEAGAGNLETTAKILTSKLDGDVATVTARWKTTGAAKGRTSSQTWKLEDGLWCQAP